MFILPVSAQGGILDSAISPGSLQLHQAPLSSVLQQAASAELPALPAAPALRSGNTSSLCGPSSFSAGAASSHCQPLDCCTLSSLASQLYHHLGNNTSFLYCISSIKNQKWFIFPN